MFLALHTLFQSGSALVFLFPQCVYNVKEAQKISTLRKMVQWISHTIQFFTFLLLQYLCGTWVNFVFFFFHTRLILRSFWETFIWHKYPCILFFSFFLPFSAMNECVFGVDFVAILSKNLNGFHKLTVLSYFTSKKPNKKKHKDTILNLSSS